MKEFFIFAILFFGFLHAVEDPNYNANGFYIPVDGAELFCQVMGKGDPVIFIQGGPGLRIEDWFPNVAKLAETNLVVLFDHRGSIRSTGELNKDIINFDTFVNDVESIRKALGFSKISIIGHCWGGAVALKYTIAHSEFVDKLALINTLPSSFGDLLVAVKEFNNRLAPYQDEIRQIKGSKEYLEENRSVLDRIQELYLIPNFYNIEMAKSHAIKQSVSVQFLKILSKMIGLFTETEYMKPFDGYPILKEINQPTLIVYGENDWIPKFTYEKIHQAIPNSKIVRLQNCGHSAILEKPEEVMEAIQDFFQ